MSWSEEIRYSTVWEDAEVLCTALAPVAGDSRLLSIASAGDNALALLTLDPAEVVALDYNPAQLACLELRMAAFRRLDHDALLRFLGVTQGERRTGTYQALRGDLSPETRGFWDARTREVAAGIIHAGRLERYLRLFRHHVLPLIHSASTRRKLLDPRTRAEREIFYDRIWNTPRWRLLFRLFFSRAVMSRLGRDPAFFAYSQGSLAEALLQRTRSALVEQKPEVNPYLGYLLTGTCPPHALPAYLRPEHHETIRSRLGRIRLVSADLESYLQSDSSGFHGFNLSDVFEYLSPTEHERLYRTVMAAARPGARLVYWNMQVERTLPRSSADVAQPLPELAHALKLHDRVWFYRALHVDEVTPVSQRCEPGILAGAAS